MGGGRLRHMEKSGWRESACKPGSVMDSHSSGMCVAAHLKQPTREQCGPHATRPKARTFLYLVLLQVGFTLPPLLPVARCALTAPFHPYQRSKTPGGIFSVALSVGLRLPGVTWHPARRSPDFPPFRCAVRRLSGRLPGTTLGVCPAAGKSSVVSYTPSRNRNL